MVRSDGEPVSLWASPSGGHIPAGAAARAERKLGKARNTQRTPSLNLNLTTSQHDQCLQMSLKLRVTLPSQLKTSIGGDEMKRLANSNLGLVELRTPGSSSEPTQSLLELNVAQ